MNQFIITYEPVLRGGAFFGLLVLFFILERLRPRRNQNISVQHFITNMRFGFMNGFLLRVIMPGGLVALALLSGDSGLMSALDLPLAIEFIACLILLDLTLYWQHRLFHKIDFLWALHGAHHGDRNLNVSSGLRFHPGEALVSFALKGAAVLVLGPPVAAVILFEVLLNGASLFNHANWSLGRFDGWIQKLIVTPDMHRLHHSRLEKESQRNFGFFLSIWDRLFASYQRTPQQAHEHIELGLDTMPDDGGRATVFYPFKNRK